MKTILNQGYYKVDFHAALPGAGGIVFIEGETVRGGDTQYLYSGKFSGTAENLELVLTVFPMSSTSSSVFGTVGEILTLNLKGHADSRVINLVGESSSGGTAITIAARWITDINLGK